MVYLKLFNRETEYVDFKSSEDFLLPNVSMIDENGVVHYNPSVEEWVDLGLPSGTLWAKNNIGATEDGDYGLYFKWGEVVGHLPTEIDASFPSFETDSNYLLTAEYDAATQILGDEYRMPTREELIELMQNTFSENVTMYGTEGRKIINKKDNSRFIFIPYAGSVYDGNISGEGDIANFWVNKGENNSDEPAAMYGFADGVTGIDYSINPINYGLSIRAVKPLKYEVVDLGLPSGTLWAKNNIGAVKESDYGVYFKFGEVTGHTSEECTHFDASIPSVELDSEGNLKPSYDAASLLMGNGFSMPTRSEMTELIDHTNHTVTTIDGVQGMKYSKKSDDSVYIFVPFAGFCYDRTFSGTGAGGYLWSRTNSDASNAYRLICYNDGGTGTSGNSRARGFSIRGVMHKN